MKRLLAPIPLHHNRTHPVHKTGGDLEPQNLILGSPTQIAAYLVQAQAGPLSHPHQPALPQK